MVILYALEQICHDSRGKGLFDDFEGLYEEKETVQQAENDGELQTKSLLVQSEDSQAFCLIKEETPRSETHEPKGHFIDSISINSSFTCHDNNECLHEYDISFIDKLPSESAYRSENSLQRKDIDLLRHTRAGLECFTILPHDNNHDQGSFYSILSSDLTPDIKSLCGIEYDLFEFSVDSPPNMSSIFRLIYDSTHEVLSYDLAPDLITYKHDQLNCMIFIDTIDAHHSSSLQEFNWQGFPQKQCKSYILEPLSIDPEPPPNKDGEKDQVTLLKFMILIQDENFCFKSLRRFRFYGCPFPSLNFLIYLKDIIYGIDCLT